jgi:hypothetical protein
MNIDTDTKSGEICWFCGKEYADAECAVFMYLEPGDRLEQRYPGAKKPGVIKVPSCQNCQNLDVWATKIDRATTWLPFVSVYLLWVIVFWVGGARGLRGSLAGILAGMLAGIIPMFIIGFVVGLFMDRQLENLNGWLKKKRGVPTQMRVQRARGYPQIDRMLQSGWVIGKPPGRLFLRTASEPYDGPIPTAKKGDLVQWLFIESDATEDIPGAQKALEKVAQAVYDENQSRLADGIQVKGVLGISLPAQDDTSVKTFVRMRQLDRGLPLSAFDYEFRKKDGFTFFVTYIKGE